jgi:hypothetical protein
VENASWESEKGDEETEKVKRRPARRRCSFEYFGHLTAATFYYTAITVFWLVGVK